MDTMRGPVSALLFMTAGLAALDVFSTMHSSPYTAEVRGGDEENQARVKHWVYMAIALALALSVGSAVIAHSLWPLVGSVFVILFMTWCYNHALARGGKDVEADLG